MSENTPTKKMKQSRLPFQVLAVSTVQSGKKRKLSGDKSGIVKKSPRSSTPIDMENVPCSGVSEDAAIVCNKEDKASASEASNGAVGSSRQEKSIDCITNKLVSSEEHSSGGDCIIMEKSSREAASPGSANNCDQKKAVESLNISNPKKAEMLFASGNTENEEGSSPPSSCPEVSICNEDEDGVMIVETTDGETSCRDTSLLSEEPRSQPQHDSSTSEDDKPSTTEPSEGKRTTEEVLKPSEFQSGTKAEKEQARLERKKHLEAKQQEKEEKRAKREFEKKQRELEKQKKQQLREEDRLKKEQLHQELQKQKDERKRAKAEELQKREEERQKKEEERQKREEERLKKEEERQLKLDEKRRAKEEEEKKKEKVKAAFVNFFVKQSDNKQSSEGDAGVFRAFQLKEGMSLAPSVPFDILQRFDPTQLDQLLEAQGPIEEQWLGRKVPMVFCRRRLPGTPRAKLLQFCENVRPAYWGTWQKKSTTVAGRHPWGKDKGLDYEVDSEEEWEEEEPGESLSGTEDEKESEDDYEVDNDVFVPHGYLSEDEENGDHTPMSPETLKARLQMRQEELQADLQGGCSRPLRPLVVGCLWQTLHRSKQGLEGFAAVRLTLNLPLLPSWEVQEPPAASTALPDSALVLLATLMHNHVGKKAEALHKFGAQWKGTPVRRKQLREALQLLEARCSGRRWQVSRDALVRLGLEHLADLAPPLSRETSPKQPKQPSAGPLARLWSTATKEEKASASSDKQPQELVAPLDGSEGPLARLESSTVKKEKMPALSDDTVGPLDRLWSAASKEGKMTLRLGNQPLKQVAPLGTPCRATPNPAAKTAPVVIEIDDESVGESIKTEAPVVPNPLPAKQQQKQPKALAAS